MDPEISVGDELDLRHYVRILNRHKWAIAISAFAIATMALVYSLLQNPVYEGDARVVLQPDAAEAVFNPQSGQRSDPARAVDTEIQILGSRPVQEMVAKDVGNSVPKVSAGPVGQTDVISVRVRDGNPAQAARVANAYAVNYVKYKQQRAVDSLLLAAREISQQISTVQTQVDALDDQIRASREANSDLRIERDSLIQQVGAFRQQLQQVQVQSRLKEGGAQVVTTAEVPTQPVSPRPLRNTVLGGFFGILLGVGIAFLREQLDDTIRSKDDVEFVSKFPVLAMIPSSPRISEGGIVSLDDPDSVPSEAYRGLRTAVQFANLDGQAKILQFTSPSQSEGKTTTLANLAVTLAASGVRVIVVCCDLRRPRVHELFGLNNDIGFTSVLLGNTPLAAALQTHPRIPRLEVLASGAPPPNPSELLSHVRTGELLQLLAERADVVLVDSPPVLPVTDALVLSRWAHSTAIVVSADETSKRAYGRALELLKQVNAPVIGTVLNGVTGNGTGYGYSYGYGYGYNTENTSDYAKPRRKSRMSIGR